MCSRYLACVILESKEPKNSASDVVTASYEQYIQSPKWERKRQQRLDFAGDRCELCNRSSNLHVHHRTYERFGEERISDLIVLCRTCHDAFHDRLALHSAPVDGAPEVEGRTLETLVDRGENHHSHAEPISTGFDKIDSVTGLRPATLNVVGARPGMRGRFLAYQFVLNAQERDASTTGMILTAREPVERLSERLLCADAKVSWHRMLEGKLGEEESERLIASKRKQADLHLINSRGWSIGELREEVQAYRRRHNVDMVVIDGFEDIQPPDPNTEWFYQASIIVAELKTLALRWNLAFVLLTGIKASVNKRSTKRPWLRDLPHDSLEREADTIMLVYRSEYYGITVDEQGNSTKGLAEVIIAKNEFGPCGTVELGYLPESDRFINIGKTAHASEDSPPEDAPW